MTYAVSDEEFRARVAEYNRERMKPDKPGNVAKFPETRAANPNPNLSPKINPNLKPLRPQNFLSGLFAGPGRVVSHWESWDWLAAYPIKAKASRAPT